MIKPTIQQLPDTKLVGMSVRMSFLNNRIPELWRGFMPRKKEVKNQVGSELYSVEIYSDPTYFKHFNPVSQFEKWAAVSVSDFDSIPESMKSMIIPAGLYAVFPFKGSDSEAPKLYQYIIGKWIPNSTYELDHRPHFAVMGEKYKNNDSES
ncbi:MAG: GyrI-like domain-containing protein, partial [Algoriphagus sp.]